MKYLKNIASNLVPLGLFLYGVLAIGPFAGEILIASIVMYSLLIVVSLVLPFTPPGIFFEERISLSKLNNLVSMLGKTYDKNYVRFNIGFDLIVVGIMAYFGYNILAMFFVVHMLAYLVLQNHIKNYIADKFTPDMFNIIPIKLQEAIERGETSFSFYELMGLQHPDPTQKGE